MVQLDNFLFMTLNKFFWVPDYRKRKTAYTKTIDQQWAIVNVPEWLTYRLNLEGKDHTKSLQIVVFQQSNSSHSNERSGLSFHRKKLSGQCFTLHIFCKDLYIFLRVVRELSVGRAIFMTCLSGYLKIRRSLVISVLILLFDTRTFHFRKFPSSFG